MLGRFAGRHAEDEIAAPALGIGMFGARLDRVDVSIAVIGLAGALRVQTVGSTNPRQYTLDVSVLILAMLVVGGMRTVSGAVVGTVIITVGNEIVPPTRRSAAARSSSASRPVPRGGAAGS